MTTKFTAEDLKKLWKPRQDSDGEDNGQITIVGGSDLFWGAPLLSLVAASRVVDMVFLATPEMQKEAAAQTALFTKLKSLIWVPREEIDAYIAKSEAILIGPGMMRYQSESSKSKDQGSIDEAGKETKDLTERLLKRWPEKKWVIDGGSLQVMSAGFIPRGAIVTPNEKEYEMLFGEKFELASFEQNAKKYECVIVHKGPVGYATDGETTYEIDGGNAGLTHGGTGDTLAGLTVGLLAKNPPLLAAAAASLVVKKTAERLYEKVGYNFNADDVSLRTFETFKSLIDVY